MIIRRYLNVQILMSTLAVLVTLFVVIAGSRIIKYFYLATQGRLDVDLLMSLLMYQSPAFLEFILPLSFFIGVMLSMGRMYIDNEVTVLAATGFGPDQLMRSMLPVTLGMLLVSALMTLYVTPRSNYRAEELFAEQAARNTFEVLRPGVFQPLDNGQVLYVRSVSEDKRRLQDVFVYGAQGSGQRGSTELRASRGYLQNDPHTGARYLTLEHGERDELVPGHQKLQRIRFDTYSLLLTEAPPKAVTMVKTLTGRQLLQHRDILNMAELYWRLSLVILVPVVAILALSLSRVNPRQGRFLKLLPGVLLYLSYIVALLLVRQSFEKHHATLIVFVEVHISYAVLSLVLLFQRPLQLAWQHQQARFEQR